MTRKQRKECRSKKNKTDPNQDENVNYINAIHNPENKTQRKENCIILDQNISINFDEFVRNGNINKSLEITSQASKHEVFQNSQNLSTQEDLSCNRRLNKDLRNKRFCTEDNITMSTQHPLHEQDLNKILIQENCSKNEEEKSKQTTFLVIAFNKPQKANELECDEDLNEHSQLSCDELSNK